MSAATPLPRRGGATTRVLHASASLARGLQLRSSAPRTSTAPHGGNGPRAGSAGRPATDGASRAAEERRARLRAVQTPARTSNAALLAMSVVATLIISVGVLGVVALNALAAEASFEAQALERDISDLTLRHDDLVAAVAQLESPNRVRDVAIGQLGLMQPEVPGFLTVDEADMPAGEPKPPVRLAR